MSEVINELMKIEGNETPEQEYWRITGLGAYFSRSFEKLKQEVNRKIVRYEYASGGETIYRGYYTPSYMNRFVFPDQLGSLIQGENLEHRANFRYSFDKNDRLIVAESKELFTSEFIYYGEGFERSVCYNYFEHSGVSLRHVTESQYDNKTLKLNYSFFGTYTPIPNVPTINDFEKEIYTYEDGKIVLIDRYDYFIDKRKEKIRIKALIQDKYDIHYDGDRVTKCTFRRGTPKRWERGKEKQT